MFDWIKRYLKKRSIEKAYERGFLSYKDYDSCPYLPKMPEYDQWQAGRNRRLELIAITNKEVYTIITDELGVDIPAEKYHRLAKNLDPDRLLGLIKLVAACKKTKVTSLEYQIGAPLHMPDYSTEITILNSLGYEAGTKKYGYAQYTRVCLVAKNIK